MFILYYILLIINTLIINKGVDRFIINMKNTRINHYTNIFR